MPSIVTWHFSSISPDPKLPKGIDVAQARASRPVDEEKVKGLITRHGGVGNLEVVSCCELFFRTKMTGEVLKLFGIWSPRNTVDMKTHRGLDGEESGHHPTSQVFFEVSEIFL